MATLEWVRDRYDLDKDRYINEYEKNAAFSDFADGTIDGECFVSVLNAYDDHTLLPVYGGTTVMGYIEISINIPIGATLNIDGVEVI